ncbi:hypothetical protein SDRG_05303 [Saprolegnia diclina VS20]|uniref:HECT domain-containing protein n=1 Tax=Saprolegnia diclina (strain VS20) TaxID=1156394 RepID=T0QQR3_SAPDV|nr:hypothetical protein SDRG_05303 [Saprolegnia diclina VS20]EQC37076.1 hypothetical protein SDRG_05303 [Saprolegnia diclina VS20]|eukprot:XP_008609238.1 hypothetical protein SDRG_05303 [Saprolegnia diclina VS20]
MGQVHATCGDSEKARRLDARWGRVTLEQLSDEAFLTKQFRRSGFAATYNQYQRHRMHLLVSKPDDDADAETHEADDLALGDAVMAVVDQDPTLLAHFSIHRLRDIFVRSCEIVDPFLTKLELQKFLLRSAHDALSSRAGARAETTESATVALSSAKGRNMPHDALLGVHVFLALVASLHEPDMREGRAQLLLDMVPLVQMLSPLALAPTPPGKGRIRTESPDALLVIERLQHFLLDMCAEPGDVSSVAMQTLLHLAIARGSVSTFLLAIRVLLSATDAACDAATDIKKVELLPDESLLDDDLGALDVKSLRKLPRVGPLLRDSDEIVMTAQLKKKAKSISPVHPISGPTSSSPSPKKNNVRDKPLKADTSLAPRPSRFQSLEIEPIVSVLRAATPRESADAGVAVDDEDEREVWSCGQNSYGELSHGDTNPRRAFERIETLQGKGIVQVCAGNEHTVALSGDGTVFTCGYNDNGQCGQGTTTRVASMTPISKLDAGFEHGVSQIHAYNGCEHTVIVNGDGAAAAFGYNYRGQLGLGSTTSESVPKVLRGLDMTKRVKLVSCSYYHTLLSVDGDAVYAFGRNDYGQLGHNDTMDRRSPAPVDALANVPLSSVACGQYHSTVVTTSGVILAFGKNDYGQLGVDGIENQLVPMVVKSGLERFVCTEVRCGYYHTIALCVGGHVYGFGRNDYGQLGIGEAANAQQRIAVPTLVPELEGKDIVRIACGCYHTLAVADNGMLYAFGRNNHGQLGTGDTNERVVPTPIDAFVGKRIAMVAAGFYHTVVLTGGKDVAELTPAESVLEATDSSAFTPEAVLADMAAFVAPGKPKPPPRTASQPLRALVDPSFDLDPEDEEAEASLVAPERPPPTAALGHVQAAVCLLAHLDRLSRAFAPRRHVYPSLAAPTPKEGAAGRFETYCVDVHSSTFLAVADIITRGCLGRDGEAAQTQVYILLASLRVLQANVTQLVRCGLGKRLVATQALVEKEPDMESLRSALHRVHAVLISLIDVPKSLRDGDNHAGVVDGKNQLVTAAVETLLIGFELFYPCQCTQTSVIFSVLKDTAPVMVAGGCACGAGTPPPIPRNRKVVLEPLLRRMADDAILAQFIPQSPQAGTESLESLASVLVERIGVQTMALLAKSEKDELRSADAAFRPYVVLLNAMQKQLASWAGNVESWTRTTVDMPVLDSVFRLTPDAAGRLPRGWRCYIEFITTVFEHCTSAIKTVSVQTRVRDDVLELLRVSMVGTVLPALATTHLLLCDRPLFAIALLTPLLDLLRLIDGLNARLAVVREAERHYMEALWLYQAPQPPATASLDLVHNLHWLLTLQKLLAQVASTMTHTLLLGESAQTTPAVDETALAWLSSPLFAHGFEAHVFAALAEHGRAVRHAPLAVSSMTLPLPPPQSCDRLRLLVQMQDGEHERPRAFCAWIRAAYARVDASYRFLLKASHALDERLENAFFAVLIKRHDLTGDAELWAVRFAPATAPPRRLLDQWHFVADLSRGFAQLKNALLNQQAASTLDDVANLRSRLLTATQFLFTLASDVDDEATVVTMPWDPPTTNSTTSETAFLAQHPRSRWRRVRSLLHTIVRWKHVLRPRGDIVGKAAIRFLLADVDLCGLQRALFDRCRRAAYRARGFEAVVTLLSHITLQSSVVDVYASVGRSLRGPLDGRVLVGLDGVGAFYEGLVRAAFGQLLSRITSALSSTSFEDELVFRTPLLLALLQCWTIAIEPTTYDLVAHLELVPTLHRLRRAATAAQKLAKPDVLGFLRRSDSALWAAMRYVFASFAARATDHGALQTPKRPLLARCFAVLQKEAELSLALMVPAFKVEHDLIVVAAGDDDKVVKRSHDVITSPMSFGGLDQGVGSDLTPLLPLGHDCNDLSVTFWIYVDGAKASAVAKQFVFARTSRRDVAPYCVLYEANDGDDDSSEYVVEIGVVAGDGHDRLQAIETASSKTPLLPNQWYHVGIVLEGPKLRLFINGALEIQRVLSASVSLVGAGSVCVGKAASPVAEMLSVHTGLQGMLAQVRVHSRALSGIHLHILFDQGPPPLYTETDHGCYQIGALLQLLAQSSEGAVELLSPRWLRVVLWMLRGGTYRVQQQALRLFAKLLPRVPPASVPLSQFFVADGGSLVQYFVRLVGFGLWRFHAVPGAGPKLGVDFPLNLAAHSLSFLEYAGDNCLTTETERSLHLAMETCRLLTTLAADATWAEAVAEHLATSLEVMMRRCRESAAADVTVVGKARLAADALDVAAGLGALAVLGGAIDTVRIGAVMELSHGRDLGTVVAFDPSQTFAQLVLQKIATTTDHVTTHASWSASVHATPLNMDTWKVLRLNVDELAVSSSDTQLSTRLRALLLHAASSICNDGASTPLGRQSHARALKALAVAVRFQETSAELLRAHPSLFQSLLSLAVQSDGSLEFITLAEAELKAVLLRRRQYELSAAAVESTTIATTQRADTSRDRPPTAVGKGSEDDLGDDEADDEADDEDDERNGEDDEDEDEDEDEDDEDDADVRAELVEELSLMGFPEDWCVMALKHTSNDILSASAWIVDNLDYFNSLQAAKDKEEREKDARLDVNEEEDDAPDALSSSSSSAVVSPTLLDDAFADKETGRKVFGELYFPFEEGGFLSNCSHLFLDAKLGNASPPLNMLESLSRFQQELRAWSATDVLAAAAAAEASLSILYARQIVATALSHVAWLPASDLGILLRFSKTVLFRGPQVVLRHVDAGVRSTFAPDRVVASLVTDALHKHLQTFGALLCDAIATELLAACDVRFEGYLWTQRDVHLGDAAALLEPSIEFAAWLLDRFFAQPTCFQAYLETTPSPTDTLQALVRRLLPCLASSNLALKLVVFRCLTLLLAHTSFADAAVKASLCAIPPLHVDCLLLAARRRHLREIAQNRLYFSPYLQGLLELVRVVQPLSAGLPLSLQLVAATEMSVTVAWPSGGDDNDAFVVEAVDADGNYTEWYSGRDLQCTRVGLRPQTSYDCRLRRGAASTTTVVATKSARDTTAESVPFTLDKKKCRSSALTFGDDGLGVAYSGNEAWRMVLGSEGFVVGRHKWQIKIDKSSSAYLFLGVASKRANLESFLGADEHSWGFIGDGALYYQRNRLKTYGDTFGEGDVIGLDLDCDLGTLSYSKNGVDLGVAFDNVIGELFPAVAFYSRHQKISLVANGFECSVGLTLHGSPKDATIDEYLGVCAVMECMVQSAALQPPLLLRAYDAYTQWCNETRARCMTRAGYDLLFDVSDATCAPFGFKAHDRVKTPRGNGTVVGVADGRLWIETEAEAGCWFYDPSKVRPRQINVQSASEPSATAAKAQPAISLDAFAACADCHHWSVAKDAALIATLNGVCGLGGPSPWNISVEKVTDVFRSESSSEAELGRIVCRVALLKLFNHDVSRTIGFFDLSWHYFGPRQSFQNASLLAATKGSLFVSLKLALLDTLLEKTLTHPKKAEDDYDYPEDLPQLVVNRPKAAVAHFKSDLETLVGQSLFGQAFDELHFLDNKVLRMVYSHPMDDGQLRTFKVKFEGEGADDYGGPYREFFSQFASELQSIKPDSADSTDGLQCILPFLMPCPNWRNGVGSHRERFVLNPSLLRYDAKWNKGSATHPVDNTGLFLEMYHFLGQILGIILRTKVLVRIDFATSIWKRLVGSPVDASDLAAVDASAYALLEQLKSLLAQHGTEPAVAEATLDALDLNFTTNLSDGSMVNLTPDGADRRVTWADLPEYMERVLETRLHESDRAIDAIKQGLCTIVPANAVALFSHDELEVRICGRAEIDVTLLMAHTEYDEDVSADDAFVQRFWRVLDGFSQDDRCAFLRFVSARSRLPMDQHGFTQKFKIQAASGEGMTQNPDDSLPKSHTCFFALLLPKYSTDDVCRKQFLYAIHNCLEMDGDFRLADTEMTGWNDVHPNDALRI